MFRKIMVPITAEALPIRAIERASTISRDFGCKVILLYVVDPKLLELMDQCSSYALSPYDRERVREQLTLNQEKRAREVVLKKAMAFFARNKVTPKMLVTKGTFSDEILKIAQKNKVDMVLLEYIKDTLLKYRILDISTIPTWLDRGRSLDNILVLASNLAPNRKAPMFAADLANMYNSEVDFCYVIDPTLRKESKDFLKVGKKQIKDFKAENPRINVEGAIREGHIEEVLPLLVKQFDPGLVIMGRFKKIKKRIFGLLVEDIKTKLAKELDTNILVLK